MGDTLHVETTEPNQYYLQILCYELVICETNCERNFWAQILEIPPELTAPICSQGFLECGKHNGYMSSPLQHVVLDDIHDFSMFVFLVQLKFHALAPPVTYEMAFNVYTSYL